MLNTTLITLAWELHEQGVSNLHIAKHLNKHRETIGLWLAGIEELGLNGFLDHYEQAKRGERVSRQTNAALKRMVWELREREFDCCGQKIRYFLQKEHQISLSVPKIYEILAEKYVIRSKWKKNHVREAIPIATEARKVVQMDSIDFGSLYAFTEVDIFSREADVSLAPALTASYGYKFLVQSMARRFNSHIALVQTDGGPEFKEEFKYHIGEFCDRHRVARPYRKNEQSYIESFNRTVRKECLGWRNYRLEELESCQQQVEVFLQRYHYHRPHMGLGMRPPLVSLEE